MSTTIATDKVVVRSEQGLCIAGTRITLFDVMDYVEAGWSADLIRDRLKLSDEQISQIMAYIESHHEEIKAEYDSMVQTAMSNRQYWEARNAERLAQIASEAESSDRPALRARLKAWKTRIEQAS